MNTEKSKYYSEMALIRKCENMSLLHCHQGLLTTIEQKCRHGHIFENDIIFRMDQHFWGICRLSFGDFEHNDF